MIDQNIPLAARMRPQKLSEFVGQSHIVGKGKLLYRMIQMDRLSSVIFCGHPGTGKTTLAKIISNETSHLFRKLNAVSAGVSDIRAIADEAVVSLVNPSGRVVLFLDEIHRLNKNQQDVLLPYIEEGKIILIGATAENPYHSVNNALLSRSTVFRFEKLTDLDIEVIIKNALADKEKGLGELDISMSPKAIRRLSELASGDARSALNALELAAMTTDKNEDGVILIDEEVVSECIRQRIVEYDRAGENHYDVASAFIKSMRNYMEPDAVLHTLQG